MQATEVITMHATCPNCGDRLIWHANPDGGSDADCTCTHWYVWVGRVTNATRIEFSIYNPRRDFKLIGLGGRVISSGVLDRR